MLKLINKETITTNDEPRLHISSQAYATTI